MGTGRPFETQGTNPTAGSKLKRKISLFGLIMIILCVQSNILHLSVVVEENSVKITTGYKNSYNQGVFTEENSPKTKDAVVKENSLNTTFVNKNSYNQGVVIEENSQNTKGVVVKENSLKTTSVNKNSYNQGVVIEENSPKSNFDNKTLDYQGVVGKRNSPKTTSDSECSSSFCLKHRGNEGMWVQDWNYANSTNYPNYGSPKTWHVAAQNFVPTLEQPYRLATSWVWKDKSCPVQVTTKRGFCEACQKLNITRILILGDSLSVQFERSLVSLLGYPPPKDVAGEFNMPPITIECSRKQSIKIDCFRRHELDNWRQLRDEIKERFQHNDPDPPFTPEMSSSSVSDLSYFRKFARDTPGRTAIVANLGAWMKSQAEFQEGFQIMLDWVDSFPKQKGIIGFFRDIIPGHSGCKPTVTEGYDWSIPVKEEPFKNMKELTAASFQWGAFGDWSEYAKKRLKERKDDGAHWHLLNNFNSGVLRRDGHVGGGDCLHYYLPGPTDWWVHFFYTALLDAAKCPD